MRIRKNAPKLSAFLQPNASTPPFTHTNHESNNLLTCQLNQSPWDIITFPSTHSEYSSSPSIHQFDDFDIHYNVNLAANWSSVDSVGSVQSAALIKNSFECEYDNANVDYPPKDYKLDDKGWQCGRTVKDGNDDHLPDLEKNNIPATDKKAKPVSRSYRPKKRVGSLVSNNDFYYYSGFGPSWGKKRGESRNNCTNFNTSSSSSNVYETCGGHGYIHVEEEQKRVSYDTDTIRIRYPCKVGPIKEDPGCVDEEQDIKIAKVKSVKKRGRKPIKARSLKSLM